MSTPTFEVVSLPEVATQPPEEAIEPLATKRCSRCGESKSHEMFSRDAAKRDGLRSHCKACNAEYRRANVEHIAEYHARWHAENVERFREYKAAHPEISTAAAYRRRGGEQEFMITARDLRRLRHVHQGNRCAICSETLVDANRGVHLDHIIPVARGGVHGIGNCQYLCRACNVRKQDRLPVELRLMTKERAA